MYARGERRKKNHKNEWELISRRFSYDAAVAIVFIWMERRKREKAWGYVSYVYSTVGSYSRPTKLLWRGESPLLAWGTIASFSISYYSSPSSFFIISRAKNKCSLSFYLFVCCCCLHSLCCASSMNDYATYNDCWYNIILVPYIYN